MRGSSSRASGFIIGISAILLYQAAVNWPPVSFASLLQMHLETWVLLGLTGLALAIDKRLAWPVVLLASLWAVLLFLYEHAARLFEVYFGRPFDLKFDFWMAGNLVDLIYDSYPSFIASLILAGTGLGLVCLLGLFATLTFLAGRALASPPRLLVWLLAGGALTALTFLKPPEPDGTPEGPGAVRSATFARELSQLVNYKTYIDAFDRKLAEEAYRRARIPTDLGALQGKDVFIIFIESYGRCIWDAPTYRQALEPRLRDFETSLRNDGYSLASSFIASSAFGGGSWLAHSTLQSGIWTDNNVHWERLLQSDVTPLPAYFNEAGYLTVSVMPAMDIDPAEWPEGDYFAFKQHLWQNDLDYDHHGYDWSPVPDQFVLLRFQEAFLTQEAPPTFAEFVMTSSHLPFSAIPPFHDGPWTYENMMFTLRNRPMQLFKENTYQALPQDVEGYSAAITYSLKTVVDFLLHRYDREAVVVLLGDHQPLRIMPGTETNHVPIHIIARDPSLIQRYMEHGFAEGWFPKEDPEVLSMDDFLPLFLKLSSYSQGQP